MKSPCNTGENAPNKYGMTQSKNSSGRNGLHIVESLDKWVPWSLQISKTNVNATRCSPHTEGKTSSLKTKLTYVIKHEVQLVPN